MPQQSQSLSRGGYSPTEIAKAFRDLHPGRADHLDDVELLRAIKETDPDTYGLIDPLLEGAELLYPHGAPKPPAPPGPPKPLPTPGAQPSWFDTAATTGLRMGGTLVGGVGGAALGAAGGSGVPVAGTIAGGIGGAELGQAAGAAVGDQAAQWYERQMGLREGNSLAETGIQAGLAMVPFGSVAGMGLPARMAIRTGQGAMLGSAGTLAEDLVTGTPPSWGQMGTSAAVGAAMGGGMHGAVEAFGAARAAAPSFGDSTGALPLEDGGPPARPDDLMPLAAASAAQFQAEEAQIASKWEALYAGHPRPATTANLSTAIQAKSYLAELAELHDPTRSSTPYEAIPPEGPPLLPAQAGPSSGGGAGGPIIAYPPGVTPNLELVGSSAPPASRIVGGGQNLSSTPPARPSFEAALESSLQTPPGPPRLVRPLVLSSPDGPPAAPESAQLGLLPPSKKRPDTFLRAQEQSGEMGGAPATAEQPRLPTVEQGVSTERSYPSGPNAGPRRTPRQEAHGAPRPVRRQVRTGGKVRYETVPSDHPAEDPGTYPPEVRRELARMAEELQELQYLAPRQQRTNRVQRPTGGPNDEPQYTRATPGAPVYHDILAEAGGARAHATRAEVLQDLRAALLEGKGSYLSDSAAVVARQRLAQQARGMKGTSAVLPPGAGDALIGWVDEAGNRALPDQDLSEAQRMARDATDGEIVSIYRSVQQHGMDEGSEPIQALLDEGVRRGVIPLQQPDLNMNAVGADGGVPMRDAGGPPERPSLTRELTEHEMARTAKLRGTPADIPDNPVAQQLERERRAAEQEVGLPGLEGVREESRAQPPVADAPFALTPPPAKPRVGDAARMQLSLWERLKNEEGVVILRQPPPSGDRAALKKWLAQQEKEYGGAAWFSRVEHHLASGDHDAAWKAATAAYVRSYATAMAAATPQQQDLIDQLVHGTPLQSDMNTQIIAAGRAASGLGTAPPVKVNYTTKYGAKRSVEMPPSARVSQAAAARGKATLGPAGIIKPGPLQRPLPANSRSHIFARPIITDILAATDPTLVHLIPGNQDRALRLVSQAADLAFQGKNTREIKAYLNLSDQEIAQGYDATIAEAARILNEQSQWVQRNKAVVTKLANQMSMGGALRGMIGDSPGPPSLRTRVGQALYEEVPALTGGKGQAGIPATEDPLLAGTRGFNRQMLLQQLRKRLGPESTMGQLVNAQISFLTSLPSTAVRNYTQFQARYSVDALDHALSVPLGRALEAAGFTGYGEFADISTHLTKELMKPFKRGSLVTPRTSWRDTLQGIYDYDAQSLSRMPASDVRQTIDLLTHVPDTAAHYMGAISEQAAQTAPKTPFPFLNHTVLDPRVQRIVASMNRAQEFTARATVYDAHVRARLRAKGLDPNEWLVSPSRPIEMEVQEGVWQADPDQPNAYGHSFTDLVEAVGGQRAFETILTRATDAALESTFAGAIAKDSIPGELVKIVNAYWPVRLAYRFPAFNFARAPRWLYDHSPVALAEVLRFPFDMYGFSPMGPGRLYRGVTAMKNEHIDLPDLMLKLDDAQATQGRANKERVAVARELGMTTRLITRLDRRLQAGLPDVQTHLEAAQSRQAALRQKYEQLHAEEFDARATAQQLKGREKTLLEDVRNAHGISAPNIAQYLARMTSGAALLGAAVLIRHQVGAEGTPWFKYRTDLKDEHGDDLTVDVRSYAPMAQYFFVGDVISDLGRHTDFDAARRQVEEEGVSWSAAIANHYEGKYTGATFKDELARAFFSISRPSGTQLSIGELMTRNGWPDTQDMGDAVIGTIGQFLSGWTMPARIGRDIVGMVDPEEAKVRTTPRATTAEPWRPLAEPLANIPGASRLIPETLSQTTGRPLTSPRPLLRGLGGVSTSAQDFIDEAFQRVGLPGRLSHIRQTGDVEIDQLNAQHLAELYQSVLGDPIDPKTGEPPVDPRTGVAETGVLGSPEYQRLSPALQRDHLAGIIPRLKAAAQLQTRAMVEAHRYEGVTVRGEEARKKARQLRHLDALDADLPPGVLESLRAGESEAPGVTPPPGPPTTGTAPAPPPPF